MVAYAIVRKIEQTGVVMNRIFVGFCLIFERERENKFVLNFLLFKFKCLEDNIRN